MRVDDICGEPQNVFQATTIDRPVTFAAYVWGSLFDQVISVMADLCEMCCFGFIKQ